MIDSSIIKVRLEIAQSAIMADLTPEQAQKWEEWVLRDSTEEPSTDVTDEDFDALTEQLYSAFRHRLRWGDILRALLYREGLNLQEAIGFAVMYGVLASKARDLIVKAIDDKEVDGRYNKSFQGGVYVNSGYVISKVSLLSWLDARYELLVSGKIEEIVRGFVNKQ